MMRSIPVVLAAFTLVPLAPAADWPQFKGPNAAGVSDEKGLPAEWGKGTNVAWAADLPARGVSCPVFVGGRVYVTASSGQRDDRLHVLAFDAATGKQLWHRQLTATGSTACHPKSCMAAPTPVADGSGVYALFATGDLAAFDADGTLRWYRSLVGDYPTVSNQVGMASSPVLVGDKLIVPLDNAGDSFLAAVDAKYGKNVWKTARPRDINWTTPLVRSVAGGGTEVLLLAPKDLTAYDADTGAKRWSYQPGGKGSIPSPTLAGDKLLLPVGGVQAVTLNDKGVVGDPSWKAGAVQTGMPSPLLYDGRVYVVNGSGVATCADAATGKVLWKERTKGAYSASPVAGDGKVYLLNETGTTTVLKAGDTYDVLATNDLGGETLATPAVADGSLFIRTDKSLYRVGAKK